MRADEKVALHFAVAAWRARVLLLKYAPPSAARFEVAEALAVLCNLLTPISGKRVATKHRLITAPASAPAARESLNGGRD